MNNNKKAMNITDKDLEEFVKELENNIKKQNR